MAKVRCADGIEREVLAQAAVQRLPYMGEPKNAQALKLQVCGQKNAGRQFEDGRVGSYFDKVQRQYNGERRFQ